MRIAVSTRRPSPDAAVEPHFGHARWFMTFDLEREAWEAFGNDPGPPGAKRAGIRTAEHILGAGVEAVITGRLDPHPLERLREAGIRVCRANGITAAAAVEEFRRGALADYVASAADRCRHDVRDAD